MCGLFQSTADPQVPSAGCRSGLHAAARAPSEPRLLSSCWGAAQQGALPSMSLTMANLASRYTETFSTRRTLLEKMDWEKNVSASLDISVEEMRLVLAIFTSVFAGMGIRLLRSSAGGSAPVHGSSACNATKSGHVQVRCYPAPVPCTCAAGGTRPCLWRGQSHHCACSQCCSVQNRSSNPHTTSSLHLHEVHRSDCVDTWAAKQHWNVVRGWG